MGPVLVQRGFRFDGGCAQVKTIFDNSYFKISYLYNFQAKISLYNNFPYHC